MEPYTTGGKSAGSIAIKQILKSECNLIRSQRCTEDCFHLFTNQHLADSCHIKIFQQKLPALYCINHIEFKHGNSNFDLSLQSELDMHHLNTRRTLIKRRNHQNDSTCPHNSNPDPSHNSHQFVIFLENSVIHFLADLNTITR